jgi:hypothetical protein
LQRRAVEVIEQLRDVARRDGYKLGARRGATTAEKGEGEKEWEEQRGGGPEGGKAPCPLCP